MIWRCRQRGQHLRSLLVRKWQRDHAGFHKLLTTQAIADWKHDEFLTKNVNGTEQAPRSSNSGQWNYPSSIEDIREAIYHSKSDIHFRSGKILPRRIAKSTQSVNFRHLFQGIEDWPESSAVDRAAWAHRVVIQFVTSREEGLECADKIGEFSKLLEPWQRKQTSKEYLPLKDDTTAADALRFYNALVSRLEQLQVALTRSAMFRGLYFAVEARSTTAMKHYLQAISKNKRNLKTIPWIQDILSSVDRWVATDLCTGWEGSRQRQELLVIITGWKEMGIQGPDEMRQLCIHDMIPASLEPVYLSIIRKLANADSVFDHWLHFKSTELQVALPSQPKDLEHSQNQIIQAYIQNLTQADDPKRAWQVVEESGSRFDDLGEPAQDALLEHPEYIGKWQIGMSGPMLRKYDEHLSRIEQSLGVRWSGGEDGFHIPATLHGEPESGPQQGD